jgi:hypothetical protein
MSVESLDRSLDGLRNWLTFWTFVVAIGLVLEYRKQLWQIILIGVRISLLRSTPFERCALKKLSVHALGGILVTLGVAGELWIEFRSSRVENDLRIASAKVIADLNNEAGDARLAAGQAIARAAAAVGDAGRANERASANEKEAARLNRLAQEERLKRVKIEERIAGWRLDSKAQKRLTDKLRAFSGTPFDLYCMQTL